MRAAALVSCAVTALLLTACASGLDGRLILTDADRLQAIARYQEALAKDPGDWLLHRRIGLARFDLRDYAQAEQSLMEAQALSPGEPVSLLYLGLSRIGKGEREAGLDLLAAFRWPFKLHHQKHVQEEAARLHKHPETPAGEAIRSVLDALAEGRKAQDELERDMRRGLRD